MGLRLQAQPHIALGKLPQGPIAPAGTAAQPIENRHGPLIAARESAATLWYTQAPQRGRRGRRIMSGGRAAIAAPRVTLEEQRLADDGGDGSGLEGLGDQEGGLRTLPGEKPLRIGG